MCVCVCVCVCACACAVLNAKRKVNSESLEFLYIRHLYFNVDTVRELFDTVPPVLIISFIRRAGLLY